MQYFEVEVKQSTTISSKNNRAGRNAVAAYGTLSRTARYGARVATNRRNAIADRARAGVPTHRPAAAGPAAGWTGAVRLTSGTTGAGRRGLNEETLDVVETARHYARQAVRQVERVPQFVKWRSKSGGIVGPIELTAIPIQFTNSVNCTCCVIAMQTN